MVDFKTDRLAPGEEPQRAEEYRPQLEAYAQALERVMEEKVCRKVLYFFSTGADNKFVNLQKVLAFCDEMWYHHSCLCERGLLYQKEVNQSNEGRNPSQLSADYYQMRLR